VAETARDQILLAVDSITGGGERTFTIAEVIAELQRRGTMLADSTIRTHIASRMCANSPDNHGTTYADFDRIDHGEHRWRK
jgi:excinuclease UvrABC helicase subunit UvrB